MTRRYPGAVVANMIARVEQARARWIVAEYPGRCARCGARVRVGERVLYVPDGRLVYSGPCAERMAS